MALFCDELTTLISGDMVLPRISTNVSVIDLEPEADPLPLFLASLLDNFDVGDIDLRANMAWLGDLPVVIALGVATTVAFYVVWPGLGQWHVARSIVPASTLAADAALFEDRLLQNIVFAAATGAAMVSGIWLLMRDAASVVARRVFYASAVVSGLFQLTWAWQLGEPTMKVISGGGFYAICGLSLIGFALVAWWLGRRGQLGLWREVMVFGVNFAFAPAMLLWLHALWYALGVIPQQYLDVGHGYILAAGGAILTPMMNGFFGAFGSSETRSRAIN